MSISTNEKPRHKIGRDATNMNKTCQGQVKIIVLIIILIFVIAGIVIYNYRQLDESANSIPSRGVGLDFPAPVAPEVVDPKIAVAPESFDLGDVIYGEVAKHTFTVKNLGGEPLKILRLSTSCGCTTAEMAEADKIIAPGQSAKLEVAFDPAVMSEPISGPVKRVVYIKTNDPERPEIEIDLTANVINQQKP
jgi:hypothetical protein